MAEPYAIPIVKTQIEEMKSSIGNKYVSLNVLNVEIVQSTRATILDATYSSQMLNNKYSI